MCGIFGFQLNRKLDDEIIVKAQKALQSLSHRGPDNINFWLDKNKGVFLGHVRLSIIDLSKNSNQPFSKGNHHLVYNGEIYNYKSLRNNLKSQGLNFISNGDTEVLLNEWINSKEKSLLKLDGMFAFALYDEKKIFLARDIFGEKPLFYCHNSNGLFFSSEIHTLKNFLNIKFSPNKEEIFSFLALGYLQNDNTGFDTIKSLRPASLLTFDGGKIDIKKYYVAKDIEYSEKKNFYDKTDILEFKNILCSSIESRLISDVPIGIFLSSGMDSTLIASILTKEFNKKIDCFCVSFADGVDEFSEAKKIADYLGQNIIKIDSQKQYDWENIPQNLINLYDTLNDNMTGELIRIMSKESKKNITVAMTGVGGDELFCGYNNYDFFQRNLKLLNNNFLNYLSEIIFKTPLKNLSRFKSFYYKINGNNSYKYIGSKNWLYNYLQKKRIFKALELSGMEEKNFFESIKKYDLNETLPNYYLSAIDHGSMRSSVEVRAPFLNKKLLEFSNKFNINLYVQKNKKFFINYLLEQYLPKNLINKKKLGFNFPIERFLKNINLSDISNNIISKNMLNYLFKNKKSKDHLKIIMRLVIIKKVLNNG